MLKILIVDDSRTETMLLKHIFETEKDMQVIGCAVDGEEAVKMTASLKPDLITMDINMPVMDGLTATRTIMSQNPTPIIIISSQLADATLDMSYKALEAGAVSLIPKPINVMLDNGIKIQKRIVDTVRSMAQIKVFKRKLKEKPVTKKTTHIPSETSSQSYEIIAIGTSVGGPQALKKILNGLPPTFSLPVVIVQHMSEGFIDGFTKWLNQNSKLTVKTAENNEILQPRFVYFAPDNHHLTIKRYQHQLTAKLLNTPPISGFCPSATVLLQSVAKTSGKHGIGILLTGMGNDGAQGLLELKKAHGHTLIQDEESSIVFGMANIANSLGAVDKTLELDKIADYLIHLSNQGQNKTKE